MCMRVIAEGAFLNQSSITSVKSSIKCMSVHQLLTCTLAVAQKTPLCNDICRKGGGIDYLHGTAVLLSNVEDTR